MRVERVDLPFTDQRSIQSRLHTTTIARPLRNQLPCIFIPAFKFTKSPT
jgi:hypothetical protein